jgi:hypothetical protein
MGKVTAHAWRLSIALFAVVSTLALLDGMPASAAGNTTASADRVLSSADAAAPTTSTTTPCTFASGNQTPSWSFVPLSSSANHLTRTAIHLVAAPGQTVTDTAVLTNYSCTELNFQVYGSDAYNTVRLGAFTLQTPNAPKVGVGKWITEPVNLVNLPPRTSDEFRFTVAVPLNTSAGDHAGGVVALNLAPPTGVGSGTQVAIQRGEGIAVYVRVPGTLHPGVAAADIGATKSTPALGFGSGYASSYYEVLNTGNVVLNGKAQLEAVNIFGNVVKRFAPVPIDALIPGQKMAVVEPRWNGLPFAGPVHLKVAITTSSINASGQAVFWVVPWLLFLIILVVIVLLIGLWIRRRRRRRRANASPAVAEGDGGTVSPSPATEVDEPATVG